LRAATEIGVITLVLAIKAIKAYREGTLPFPDGSINVALHWKRVT
jgi:hypothetical protein